VDEVIAALASSCRRLRAARARAEAATRSATRCNHDATPNRPCPDRQNQKCRLKGVFDLVPIAEHAAADAQHLRPVSSQERGES
jgi:hypothetical protein